MSNLEIREFSQSIINCINQNALPIEVKRLVLAEIQNQLNETAREVINLELAEREKVEQEGKANEQSTCVD